ncbi:unnamed protein product, partial [Adineta steineri]
MVFKGAAKLIVRLSRTLISRPFKPIFNTYNNQLPALNKQHQVYSKYPLRFYLFPSIYRSFLTPTNGQNLSNLMPFRIALNEIKRRLFFTAPSSSRFALGLLGYSLVPQSTIDRFRIDKTLTQIGNLLSKTSMMDQFNNENEKHNRAVLDDYELGRLLGCGCNAAVYEARLRSSSSNTTSCNFTIPSERYSSESESDIDILSHQSSLCEDVYENEEERINELTLDEVRNRASVDITQSSSIDSDILPAGQFNLAIKMLFNYGIQSNAEALKKAMNKELIPLREYFSHPNIVPPSSSRFALGLLGYSLVPQSTIDRFRIDETLTQIGNLLSKTSMMDQFNNENEKHNRAVLDDYELGRLLGCGCNAAVYEARLRSSSSNTTSCNFTIPSERYSSESESDIDILSHQSSLCEDVYENEEERINELTLDEVRNRASIDITQSSSIDSDILPAGQFNLAIKMLFNYGIQSNAEALKKAMNKELIPLREYFSHPNIVRMYSCFVDSFPLLNEAHDYYPMAIPTRLSPDGYGRNKTLFIVMRKYDLTLNEYIHLNQPTDHERLLLFTQLLEALLYLNNQSIVHRDLKSDNLLICQSTGELVLADFGCALYQPPDLKLSYQTDEVCKGGNLALMAPEILTCQPGPKSYLDFNKSDLWASGTLCYEFFSQSNPFFHGSLRQD